ncbi:MAG: nucleotidyltransferase domain-containing protein [Candidatus Helarchaeota archaeon]
MQKKSLIKLKNTLNKMKMEKALSNFISKIVKEMTIKCIILFGSRARGDFKQYSDVDLIIIGNFSERFLDRSLKLTEKNNSPYNFEIFCYTEQEFKSMFKRGNVIILDAIYEGIPLYGKEFFKIYKDQMNLLIEKGLKRSKCTWILI